MSTTINATNIQILETIRDNAGTNLKNVLTQTVLSDSWTVFQKITGDSDLRNEFIDTLYNRIGKVIINDNKIENVLEKLKSGSMPFGKNVEDIMVNPACGKEYSYTSEDLFKAEKPDVKSLVYTIDRQQQYKVTITLPMLQRAFTSEGGLAELIGIMVSSLTNGSTYDEFLLMKDLSRKALANEHILSQEFTKDSTYEDVLQSIKADSLKMTFPGSNYNTYKKVSGDTKRAAIVSCKQKDQCLLIQADMYTALGVNVLASAFNLSIDDFRDISIPVDDFNGAPIFALLCDKRWFQVRDNIIDGENFRNPEQITTTYYRTVFQSLGYRTFANAKVYTFPTDDTTWKTIGKVEGQPGETT